MTLKLYGTVTSACTQRVILVLHELDIKYDFIPVALMKGEHKVSHIYPAEFLRRRSDGKTIGCKIHQRFPSFWTHPNSQGWRLSAL